MTNQFTMTNDQRSPISLGHWSLGIGHLLVIGAWALRLLPRLILGAWSFGLLLQGGCNVVGAIAHVAGPPAVEPLYVPAQTPMPVLAENYANPSADTVDAEQLERFV